MPDDAAVPNQHRGVGVPAVAVENAVRQDGMTVRHLAGLFRPGLINVHGGLD